jgi:hypothetical protein
MMRCSIGRERERNHEQAGERPADEAREQSNQRAIGRLHGVRVVLLHQIHGQRTSADDPHAAETVAEIDDRQRRQHADEQPAEKRRLELGCWRHQS